MSKGSKQRPSKVSNAEYQANWDNIYNKDKAPQFGSITLDMVNAVGKQALNSCESLEENKPNNT